MAGPQGIRSPPAKKTFTPFADLPRNEGHCDTFPAESTKEANPNPNPNQKSVENSQDSKKKGKKEHPNQKHACTPRWEESKRMSASKNNQKFQKKLNNCKKGSKKCKFGEIKKNVPKSKKIIQRKSNKNAQNAKKNAQNANFWKMTQKYTKM